MWVEAEAGTRFSNLCGYCGDNTLWTIRLTMGIHLTHPWAYIPYRQLPSFTDLHVPDVPTNGAYACIGEHIPGTEVPVTDSEDVGGLTVIVTRTIFFKKKFRANSHTGFQETSQLVALPITLCFKLGSTRKH